MRRPANCFPMLVLMLLAATVATADVAYQWDDGGRDNAYTSGATREALALISYDALAGGEFIVEISGQWGPTVAGSPARVVLYEDPNDDGNPVDADLLAEVAFTMGGTDSTFTVPIPGRAVSGVFFVGVVWVNPNGDRWIGLDDDAGVARSWFSSSDAGGTLDLEDLSTDPPFAVDDYTFMVRARGTDVPDIPTLSNVALALLALLLAVAGAYLVRR